MSFVFSHLTGRRRNKFRMRNSNLTRVKRAEMLLNKMTISQNCELTKEGANFVKQRFDPYHDLPMKPAGYPDSYNGSTVSRCVKKTITIGAQSAEGPVPTSTWNCHIFSTPILDPAIFTPITGGNGNVIGYGKDLNNSRSYGGIMMQRSDSDGPSWSYPQAETSTNVLGQLSLSRNDLKNVMRVTSIGFEVIDETAELYKQGTLTAYRQNQQQKDPFFCKMIATSGGITTADHYVTDATAMLIKKPPVTTAAAMMIPNTKQWLVKEGAYCVIDFHDNDIPMTEPEYILPILIDDATEYVLPLNNAPTHVARPASYATGLGIGITTNTPTILHYTSPTLNRIYPINTTGVFLTGLNPQASITVNAIFYVECAPTGEDEELLSLCSQSPAYDPLAMELISKLRRDCPIAVKLRENYMGEWFFNGIKNVINTALPWLSNAQIVAKQVGNWIDTASTNDGYINPQSFVKGDVATKTMLEKNPKPKLAVVTTPAGSWVPKAPGPAPMKKAFRPNTSVVNTLKGPNGKIETRKGIKLTRAERKEMKRYRAAMAARGKYKSSRF